jgi:uncharacterized protein YukE
VIWNFNYDKAIEQARRVENVAAELRGLANNKISGAIASVNAAWSGEAANQFLRHCEETKRRVYVKADELYDIAQRVRNVAKILHDAETEARRKMEEISRRASGGGATR